MEDSWNALLKSISYKMRKLLRSPLMENTIDTYVRISQDELSHLNRTSTPVQDGSGDFLGSLGKSPIWVRASPLQLADRLRY